LASHIEPETPLSALRISAEGREVVVRQGRVAWQPESGQTVFLFDVQDLARCTKSIMQTDTVRCASDDSSADAMTAAGWFERAMAVEDDEPRQACLWYRRALDLDPNLTDAYINLGRLIHEAGDTAEALSLYGEALKRAPDDAVGHYDLALVLEDTGDPTGAIGHYREALRAEPGFADAHHNLGRLLEKMGRRAEALWHRLVYMRLTRST